MEVEDVFVNSDWDPEYLACIFDEDFNDISDLWVFEVDDKVIIDAMENIENCHFG